jgi:hypothetical protein
MSADRVRWPRWWRRSDKDAYGGEIAAGQAGLCYNRAAAVFIDLCIGSMVRYALYVMFRPHGET